MSASGILEQINKPENNLHETAMIETSIPEFSIDDYPVPSDTSIAETIAITPHYLKIRTQNNQSGLLVISELYDEQNYWQAYVDSMLTCIYRVNYILRGVVIPPGKHILEMHYELPHKVLLDKMRYWAMLMILILLLTEIISKLWLRIEGN